MSRGDQMMFGVFRTLTVLKVALIRHQFQSRPLGNTQTRVETLEMPVKFFTILLTSCLTYPNGEFLNNSIHHCIWCKPPAQISMSKFSPRGNCGSIFGGRKLYDRHKQGFVFLLLIKITYSHLLLL